MINLIHNELLKIVRKKKLIVVIMIMAVLISMFTYAQYREQDRIQETLGTKGLADYVAAGYREQAKSFE